MIISKIIFLISYINAIVLKYQYKKLILCLNIEQIL